jgi:signal transduction histidine kinase
MQSVRLFGEKITDSILYTNTTAYYDIPQGLKLPPSKNNLTFTFMAVSLSNEAAITYRYLLHGVDTHWGDWSQINTVTYSALPSGKYELEVQCSANGQPIDKKLRYSFTIITPFYKTPLFRILLFAACIFLGIAIQYLISRNKQRRQKMLENLRKQEQAIVRQRTAEDFHDEIGNKLTRINVLTNVLRVKIKDESHDANRIIEQINDNTNQLYSGARDILWSLIPSNDSFYEIAHHIRDIGSDLFEDTDTEFIYEGTDEHWRNFHMPIDASRNLIMIFKEALNNCIKYSKATKVLLTVSMHEQGSFSLCLNDNGIGYNKNEIRLGNGLKNMATRAARINGVLTTIAEKGKGVSILLVFKIPQNK